MLREQIVALKAQADAMSATCAALLAGLREMETADVPAPVCTHPHAIDASTMGGPERKYCSDCRHWIVDGVVDGVGVMTAEGSNRCAGS